LAAADCESERPLVGAGEILATHATTALSARSVRSQRPGISSQEMKRDCRTSGKRISKGLHLATASYRIRRTRILHDSAESRGEGSR
jgi:hypothetical protein